MKKILIILLMLIFSQNISIANSSIILENVSQKDTLNQLIKIFVTKGAYIEDATNYSFTATSVNKSFLASFFLGSSLVLYPEEKLNFSAIQSDKDVILSLTLKIITNTGNSHQGTMYASVRKEKEILRCLKEQLIQSTDEKQVTNKSYNAPETASKELFNKGYNAANPSQLYMAVYNNDYELTKLFVEAKKVDINKRYLGTPYLFLATSENNPEIALLLLNNGANPNIKTIDGGSSLFYAVKNGQTEVVKEMLKTKGMNINRHRMLFRVPLVTTAKRKGNTEIAEILINYKKEYELTKMNYK